MIPTIANLPKRPKATNYDAPLDLRYRDGDGWITWMDVECVKRGTWVAFDEAICTLLVSRGVAMEDARQACAFELLSGYATFLNDCIKAGLLTLDEWRGVALFIEETYVPEAPL